jgi:hypothetical protein
MTRDRFQGTLRSPQPACVSANSMTLRRNASPPQTQPEVQAKLAAPFHLTKWYLDCIGENRQVLIAYWAELRWRRLAGHYASAMFFSDGRCSEHSSVRTVPAPRISGGNLQWSCDALGIRGEWRSLGLSPHPRVLFRNGCRILEWKCVQPLAEAKVRCGTRLIGGYGYAECITLTLAPWELPIQELRWGRAHFPGRSAVWIDWTGAEPMRLVLVDAEEVEGVRISDDLVSTPAATIRLTDRRALREGPVGHTTAGSVPGVRQALSKAGLLIEEHKWLSRATLEEHGTLSHGNAIHEVVRWR